MAVADLEAALEAAALATGRITAGELARLFTLAPEQAIAWFESLGIAVSWDWQGDWRAAREHAFTLSKVADRQILAGVKEEVAAALRDGVSQREFRARLEGRLAAAGWLRPRRQPAGVVDLSRPWRMDVIFRTNAQTAMNVGRQQAQLEFGSAAPFWQYVAVLDDRTRPGHAALNGAVYRSDDPVWASIYPPNGFNCRCRVRALTQAQVDRRRLKVLSGGALPAGAAVDRGWEQNPLNPAAGELVAAAAATRAEEAARRAAAQVP